MNYQDEHLNEWQQKQFRDFLRYEILGANDEGYRKECEQQLMAVEIQIRTSKGVCL